MAAPKLGARGLTSPAPAKATAPSPSRPRTQDARPTSPAASDAVTKRRRRPAAPAVNIMGAEVANARAAEARLHETLDVARWPIDKLKRDEEQPRTEFDSVEIEALARDIAQRGLDKPIDLREERGEKLIVDGERRWRAYKLLHERDPHDPRWHDIPARLLPPGLTLDEVRLRQLAASLHNLPYSAIDYARQLAHMAELAIKTGLGETRTAAPIVTHLAGRVSRGETWVRRHLYLAEGLSDEELHELQTARPGLPLGVLEEVLRALRKAGPLLTDDLRASIFALAVGRVGAAGEGGAGTDAPEGRSDGSTGSAASEPSYHSAETLRRLYGRMVGRAATRGTPARRVVSGARKEVIRRDGIQLEYQLGAKKMRPDELHRLATWLRAKAEEVERIGIELEAK